MHASMDFWVTLVVSIASTGLISRILFLILARWDGGFNKPLTIHCTTLGICWVLFVIWCSTAGRIYWSAGHVAFMPQCAWFMFDLFQYTGQHDHFDEDEAEGSGEY